MKTRTHTSDNAKLAVKGYADGGKVLPAAQKGGGVLYQAVQKAGLRADNATLSRVSALVDQGYPVDKATQIVATQNQGKGFALGGLVDPSNTAEKQAIRGRQVNLGGDPNAKQKPIRAGKLY